MKGMGSLVIIFFVSTMVPVGLYFGFSRSCGEVQGEQIVTSPSPVPSLSPSPSPSPSPIPSPNPIPSPAGQSHLGGVSPSPTPVPVSSQQINEYINKYAGEYGVDPNVLRHIAVCESGFDPTIEHLSYVGLYQFGPMTWKTKRMEMGRDPDDALRWDVEEQVVTAAWIVKMGYTNIWPNCVP